MSRDMVRTTTRMNGMFWIRIKYLDGSGKEVGYWSNFSGKRQMHKRFAELGILLGNITHLEVRKAGESDFKKCNVDILEI